MILLEIVSLQFSEIFIEIRLVVYEILEILQSDHVGLLTKVKILFVFSGVVVARLLYTQEVSSSNHGHIRDCKVNMFNITINYCRH